MEKVISILFKSLLMVFSFAYAAPIPVSINNASYEVDFETSMRNNVKNLEQMDAYWARPLYEMFKGLYERNNLTRVAIAESPKIPKIIHHIWLGSSLPQEYNEMRETWLRHHPDWQYRLWTDSDVAEAIRSGDLFTEESLQYFNEAVNYAEKADILRYLILYKYGGLYTDISDFECLRSFDILHHAYDFYVGLAAIGESGIFINNALCGSRPGHPILKYCIEMLRDHRDISLVIMRTGPTHFTRACAVGSLHQDAGTVGIFPTTFFYPRGREDVADDREKWLKPESFAIHHWSGSWRIKGDANDKRSFARDFSPDELKKYTENQPLVMEHWSKPILIKDDWFIQNNCGLWWHKTLDKVISLEKFEEVVGGVDFPSRVAVREHIKKQGYRTLLDVPCGLGLDYVGFKKEEYPIEYRGIDINTALVHNARRLGIPVVQASIEDIPYFDKSCDVVYARYILEHLDSYKKALLELIRVADKEVVIVFCHKPRHMIYDEISYVEIGGTYLYMNYYARGPLEDFILAHPRVRQIVWEPVGEQEEILHIYVS